MQNCTLIATDDHKILQNISTVVYIFLLLIVCTDKLIISVA